MPPGGPYKCTEEVQALLIEALSHGATYEVACDTAGISTRTLALWLTEGEKQERGEKRRNGCYFLYCNLKKEKARISREALDNIRAAGGDPRNWMANAWLLERLYPESYGRPAPRTGKQEGEELEEGADG